jgi:hypothetical protein
MKIFLLAFTLLLFSGCQSSEKQQIELTIPKTVQSKYLPPLPPKIETQKRYVVKAL